MLFEIHFSVQVHLNVRGGGAERLRDVQVFNCENQRTRELPCEMLVCFRPLVPLQCLLKPGHFQSSSTDAQTHHHTSRMLALGVAGTAFQGFQISKAFKGFGSSFDGACPSTPVPFGVACGMRITTVAAASCDDVLVEINARVNGQSGVWHDPHNNGTYAKCVPAPATHSAYIPPPEGAPSEGTPTPDPKPDPNHRPHHLAAQRA